MRVFAEHALLPDGWAANVAITIDERGRIAQVAASSAASDDVRVAGPVLPGMPNLHSHVFQRALAGRTGRANKGAAADSFWTWRAAMYAFLERVGPDEFEAIAAQGFLEMLKAGYTRVAEFHYVHHDPQGRRYADPAELARRVIGAARQVGLPLTLLPVFYAHGGFGGAEPSTGQRRFVCSVDAYARLVSTLVDGAGPDGYSVGVAPHSLRAATPQELAAVVALAPADAPIHIHIAEQTKEVADCLVALGARPVEWLLSNAAIDRRWCLVHATHMTDAETDAVAASGAVVGLAPTTEADLGDGVFSARRFLDHGGQLGIGSDSNTIIDPFAELRQLELSQRLACLERNVLARGGLPVGQILYRSALAGGAAAVAQPCGAIVVGARADLVVLNPDEGALAEQDVGDVIDAAVFGPCRRPVRDVMVAGRWVVRDGHHSAEEEVFSAFRAALKRLRAD